MFFLSFAKRHATRIFACLMAFLPQTVAGQTDRRPAQPLYFVFLNTGVGRSKVKTMSQQALEKMQADHVGNLGALGRQGRGYTAGPLGDNGFIRGIVVLNARTPEEVKDCFKNDPFVQNDILAAEALRWQANGAAFGEPVTPFQIAQHTLGIVKRGPNWRPGDGSALSRWLPSLPRWERSDVVAVSGPLLDAGERLGILLFRSEKQAEVQAQLAREPGVRSGEIVVELHPQYLGKGALRTAKEGAPPPPGRRVRLFDGRTFAGWSGDTKHTWRVEKGALVGGSLTATVPHNDFLTTEREYGDFDLRLKVKLVGTGFVNGGIQIRSQRKAMPPDDYEMIGYQADMGEGYWGSLYDESRRNRSLALPSPIHLQRLLKPNAWNDYIIRCEGRRIRLWLNGELTVDYTEPEADIPLRGRIGLQIHGGGKAEASYKDITIAELPKSE